jgi:hypothetical protein
MTERMKRLRLAFAIAALTTAAAAPAAWDGNAFVRAPASNAGAITQAQWQKGGGGRQGGERERGGQDRGRDMRQDRHDDRRNERMSEDDRRSFHRDLDKANRELYGRRYPK